MAAHGRDLSPPGNVVRRTGETLQTEPAHGHFYVR
jgi:hypothetical protein